jgi:C4-dicarboxylate transporter, DctQ subunit
MRAAQFLLTWLFRLETTVAAAAFITVVVVLLADVLGREFFGHGIYWGPRLASYCTTVAGMLGFAIVVGTGGHLRPRNLDALLPAAWDGVLGRLGHLISAGICLWLVWYSAVYIAESYAIGTRGMGIEIVIWPIQIIVPYVFVSGALRYVSYACYPALAPREELRL